MKKLIFAGIVVLLGTACTSSGGFDGSAHSAGGSTAGMVAKVVDGEEGENPIEVNPSTPDYVEVSNPVEPEWDGDYGWGKPGIDPDNPDMEPENGWPGHPENPSEQPDGDYEKEVPSGRPDNSLPHDDNGTENNPDSGWGKPVAGTPSNPIEVTPDNDRPHDDNGDGGIDTGWGQERPSENPPRVSVDDRMERTPDNDTPGHDENERPSIERPIERERPSDNRESNRRDRDHSRDRNGNATGRSVDGRAKVGHF